MPSIRKRIGYLPSVNIQKIIIKIAKKENISQSKVVGILVEEALSYRVANELQNNNDLMRNIKYRKETNMNHSTLKYSDLDELISDKGITYSTNKYTHKSDNFLTESKEAFNGDLFELFKQFILFQKMMEER